jgi:hypothetical protein
MKPIRITHTTTWGGIFPNVRLDFCFYGNGRPAIRLMQDDPSECIAVATVNLPERDIPDTQIAVKDYSENEGMVDTLRKAGVIHDEPVLHYTSGHVLIPLFDLTPVGIAHVKAARQRYREESA